MYVEKTDSTNTLLQQLIAEGNPPEYIYAGFQTSGRGQIGNGWESEAGKNLLCSVLLPPNENLFDQNVMVSVAVHRLVSIVVDDKEKNAVTIKWPNDIYWKDKKIAGILIENAITGRELRYSIGGIGLNVNQTSFVSNAPNPVSLKQISGRDYDIKGLMGMLMNELEHVESKGAKEAQKYYRAHLYRREGYWPYLERAVSILPTMNATVKEEGQFLARIEDILPTGEIILSDTQNKQRIYHFKQIRYVL